MSVFNKNNVMRGTDGRVFFDGEQMGYVESFEAKETYNKEEIYANGDYRAKHIFTGSSLAGTYTGFKQDSAVLLKYQQASRTGVMPELTIVGKIVDPASGKVQRVRLDGVMPDEIMLIAFENNTLLKEEIPFTADSYEVIDGFISG